MKLTQIEGKSPHKKGSAKYKKHMAAKHAAMGEKVEAMKGLVERAKHVKANSKKPKLGKPSKGHQSPHPYHKTPDFVGGESVDIDEISKKDIQAAALTGAIGLGSIGLGNQIMNMHQGALDHSIQLPQLEMYLDYAESQNDQRMIKQLKNRIRNHKGRLTDMGDLNGPDGTPMSFEVVYDKENPNFDPLGDPLELNKKFAKARDAKNESKKPDLPKQSNPVAKHSRNKSGAGAHKSAKDYDRKKEKQDLKKMNFDEGMSASKSMLINSVLKDLQKKAQEGGDDQEGLKFLRKLASLVGKKVIVRDNGSLMLENRIPFTQCPSCGGDIVHESELQEAKKKKKAKRDACYHKVKSRYKVWPSAYASGALVQCRKKGAKNWGNKSKKK